jgi:hypothetical protein
MDLTTKKTRDLVNNHVQLPSLSFNTTSLHFTLCSCHCAEVHPHGALLTNLITPQPLSKTSETKIFAVRVRLYNLLQPGAKNS